MVAAAQSKEDASVPSADPPCDPDRQHPARLGARHLRCLDASERARQQPGERRDARLPSHGPGLPRRARPGHEDERRDDDRGDELLPAAGPADDARRRQRRRRRHGVRADGQERSRVRGPRERREGAHPDRPDRVGRRLMGLFDAIDISASGLSAERLRMDVTAENLANAQTTRGPNGGPYQRREVVLQTAQPNGFATQLARATTGIPGMPGTGSGQPPGGVQAAGIVADATPPRQVYDPGHPDANAQGYVLMPNVNPVTEMVDLIASSRSYEANVTALQTAKSMFSKTFDLLR